MVKRAPLKLQLFMCGGTLAQKAAPDGRRMIYNAINVAELADSLPLSTLISWSAERICARSGAFMVMHDVFQLRDKILARTTNPRYGLFMWHSITR